MDKTIQKEGIRAVRFCHALQKPEWGNWLDPADLKSADPKGSCEFESRLGHKTLSETDNVNVIFIKKSWKSRLFFVL